MPRPSSNQPCIDSRRVGVLAPYCLDWEFKKAVSSSFKASLGVSPAFRELMPDRSIVAKAGLEAATTHSAISQGETTRLTQKFSLSLRETQFIDGILKTVLQRSSVNLTSECSAYIADCNQTQKQHADCANDRRKYRFQDLRKLGDCFDAVLPLSPSRSRSVLVPKLAKQFDQKVKQFPRNGLRVIASAENQERFSAIVTVTIASAAACLSKICKRYVSCNVRGRP